MVDEIIGCCGAATEQPEQPQDNTWLWIALAGIGLGIIILKGDKK